MSSARGKLPRQFAEERGFGLLGLDRIGRRLDADLWVNTFNLGIGADPDPYPWYHSSQIPAAGRAEGYNRGGYSNPELDPLLVKGRTVVDQAERKRIYAEVQRLVSRDLPLGFLFFRKELLAANKRLQNIEPFTYRDVFWNAEQWWMSE